MDGAVQDTWHLPEPASSPPGRWFPSVACHVASPSPQPPRRRSNDDRHRGFLGKPRHGLSPPIKGAPSTPAPHLHLSPPPANHPKLPNQAEAAVFPDSGSFCHRHSSDGSEPTTASPPPNLPPLTSLSSLTSIPIVNSAGDDPWAKRPIRPAGALRVSSPPATPSVPAAVVGTGRTFPCFRPRQWSQTHERRLRSPAVVAGTPPYTVAGETEEAGLTWVKPDKRAPSVRDCNRDGPPLSSARLTRRVGPVASRLYGAHGASLLPSYFLFQLF